MDIDSAMKYKVWIQNSEGRFHIIENDGLQQYAHKDEHLDSNRGTCSGGLSANVRSFSHGIDASDSHCSETTLKLGFNQRLVKL